MELIFLGHACWLAQFGELRILFDPLLSGAHRGGVHEVFPRRRVHANELRPDFIVVSHAHADHFDVPSLAVLAELDPDTVVLTSDPLVERSARRLGFGTVRRLQTFDRVELTSGELLTTPSYGTELEWGVLLRSGGATVWNQVDSVAGGPARIGEMLELSARALGSSDPRVRVDCGLVRFQSLLEIQAQIGGATGFPLRAHQQLLDEIAALDARAIVPAAAGARHTDAHAFMNHITYPLSEARFLRDVAQRAPRTRALASRIGARYRVFPGGAEDVGDAPELVQILDAPDDRFFRPFELPPIVDPAPGPDPELWPFIERWVREELSTALARAFVTMGSDRPLSFALEVIGSEHCRHWTLCAELGACQIRDGLDPDYDALVAIAASELRAVVCGDKSWADPLLAGLLRMTTRAYRVDESGVRAIDVGVPFLYYALSYEQSVENAVDKLVSACDRSRAGSPP